MVALILTIGNTYADNEGPAAIEITPLAGETSDSAMTYWTPERMQDAVPMPFPPVVSPVPGGVEEENSLEPEISPDNSPGFAPGSEPSSAPLQSTPESYLESSPDDSQKGGSVDLPQDTPPPNSEQPSDANSSERPNNDFLQLSSATEELPSEKIPSTNNDSTVTDKVTQPVLCDTNLPPLETYAFNSQGESLETQTQISGGVAVNQGDFQRQVTQKLSDPVEVVGHICTDPQHLGQLAKLVVYATYQPLTSSSNEIQYYMLNTDSQIIEWDGELAHGVPFRDVVLEQSQSISIYQGQFPAPGLLNIYFGYWLPAIDRFVFNREAIEVKILD